MTETRVINGRVVDVRHTAVGVKYINRPLTTMESKYEAWKAEQRKEKMLRESITSWGY